MSSFRHDNYSHVSWHLFFCRHDSTVTLGDRRGNDLRYGTVETVSCCPLALGLTLIFTERKRREEGNGRGRGVCGTNTAEEQR